MITSLKVSVDTYMNLRWKRGGSERDCCPSVIRLTSVLCVWFLLSDALLQHLPSYWVSLTLDEGYLLTAATSDLERGIDPLGPLVPAQPPLLGSGVAPLGCHP